MPGMPLKGPAWGNPRIDQETEGSKGTMEARDFIMVSVRENG